MTGEIAASISYDASPPPAGLGPDYTAPDGVSLRFLAIKALDGKPVEAALWQPVAKPTGETTLVVMVHGSGGNYHSPPQSSLPPRLAANGYASLAINTRQHDGNINTDNFMAVRRDIEAAVQVGRALGYRRLVLQGHSLGNIQVQFYAAQNWDADIKAVLLLGAFGNLPWKTQNILVRDDAKFKQLIGAAKRSLREGTQDQLLPIRMPYCRGGDSAVTAQHFLTYRWDKSAVADGTYWISRIPKPVLLVLDEADALVQPFELMMLETAAKSEGSLNTRVQSVVLKNANPSSLQAHSFIGNEDALASTVLSWLKTLEL